MLSRPNPGDRVRYGGPTDHILATGQVYAVADFQDCPDSQVVLATAPGESACVPLSLLEFPGGSRDLAPAYAEQWTTKDSGVREQFDSGMVRDTEKGKPRFDLMWPVGVPYARQFLTRFAGLLGRGAEKYGDRNWEKGAGQKELDRAISSASRHFAQWVAGETDEDHAAAVVFNLMQAETLRYKMEERNATP